MIKFECPKCHASLEVEDSQAGLSAQCPQCSNINSVPGSGTAGGNDECGLKSKCSCETLPAPDEKSRMWCGLCHLGGLLPSVPLNIIIPLVFWLIKKDELPDVDKHGKAALNFQITCSIAYVISLALVCVFIGAILLPLVFLFNFIFSMIAIINAANGKEVKYPFVIRFIS